MFKKYENLFITFLNKTTKQYCTFENLPKGMIKKRMERKIVNGIRGTYTLEDIEVNK